MSTDITKKNSKTYQDALRTTSEMLETEFSEIQKLNYLLVKNLSSKNYIRFYSGNNGRILDYLSLQDLREMLTMIRSIKKSFARIIVHVPSSNIIISDESIYQESEYYAIHSNYQVVDKKVFDTVTTLDYFRVYPAFQMNRYAKDYSADPEQMQVVTITISCLDLYNVDATVIINLDESVIQEEIEARYNNRKTKALVLDHDGAVILGVQNGMNLSEEERINLAQEGDDINGKRLYFNQQLYVVESEPVKFFAWRVYYLTPIMDYYTPLIQYIAIWVVILTLLILLILFMSHRFSTNLYRPIERLLSLLRKPGAGFEKAGLDEMHYIEENFRNLENSRSSLLMQIDKMGVIAREHILSKIILYSDDSITQEDVTETLKEYEIRMDAPYCLVALFNIYRKPLFFEQYCLDEQRAILMALPKMFNVYIKSHFENVVVSSLEEGRTLIVINDRDPNCDRKLRDLLFEINGLIQSDREYIQFSFAIGEIKTNFYELHDSFLHINEECSFYCLNRFSPLVEEGTMNRDTNVKITHSVEENLRNAVLTGNRKNVSLIVGNLFQCDLSDDVTPYRFKKLVNIMGALYDDLAHAKLCDPVFWKDMACVRFYSVERTRDLFLELFVNLCGAENEDRSRMLTQYIDENYNNPNLSLQNMADHFQFNRNYLSRLFKEKTGFVFSEYLNEIRMQNAKQLLRETDMQIDNISELVGISSRRTFNRAFKKHTGISPAMYRLLEK